MFPPEPPLPERPQGDGSATYVNIPISPTSKKQLNYMELELQEAGGGTRATASHPPPQSKHSSQLMLGRALLRYPFLDNTDKTANGVFNYFFELPWLLWKCSRRMEGVCDSPTWRIVSKCYITAVNTQATFTAFLLAIEMLLSLSSPLDVTKVESLRFSCPEGAVMGAQSCEGFPSYQSGSDTLLDCGSPRTGLTIPVVVCWNVM